MVANCSPRTTFFSAAHGLILVFDTLQDINGTDSGESKIGIVKIKNLNQNKQDFRAFESKIEIRIFFKFFPGGFLFDSIMFRRWGIS